MSRLPTPGADNGTWGSILNDFLSVEHNADGTLKSGGSLGAKANDATVVHNTGAETVAGVKTFSSSPIVPTPSGSTDATNKTYVDTAVSGAVVKTGDNLGTLTSPTSTNGFLTVNLNYAATGSTPDALAFYYNGVRTGYHNEKGELRSRAAADNSTPFRVQQRSTGQTANLTEWTQSDNTPLAYVGPTGIISAPNIDRKVSYGASQPTDPSVGDLWVQP
jgi:hypothetical protein